MRRILLVLFLAAGCAENRAPGPVAQAAPPPPPPSPRADPPAPAQKSETPAAPFNGEKLTSSLVTPKDATGDHVLIAFVSSEPKFNAVFESRLKMKDQPEVDGFPEDANRLFVLWGRKIGNAEVAAEIDRKKNLVVVTVKWSGSGFMRDQRLAPYIGYAFGPIDGEFTLEVREFSPVSPDEAKVTKRVRFVPR